MDMHTTRRVISDQRSTTTAFPAAAAAVAQGEPERIQGFEKEPSGERYSDMSGQQPRGKGDGEIG